MPPGPSQEGEQSVLDELGVISENLTRLQRQVAELKHRYRKETEALKNELADLKSENLRTINAAKWMKVQNEELQARLERAQPDADNVVQTRGKLERYRKVFRNFVYDNIQEANQKLLYAKEEGLVTDSEESQNDDQHDSELWRNDNAHQDPETTLGAAQNELDDSEERVEIQEVHDLLLPLGLDDFSSDNGSPGPSRTRRISPQLANSDQSPTSSRSSSVLVVHSPASLGRQSIEVDSPISISGTLPSEMIPEGASYSVQPLPGRKEEIWALQFGKPPATCRVTCGPIRWAHMRDRRRVGLDNNTVNSLQSLTLAPDLELRLQIVDNLAFVHNPVFLEDRSTPVSYLIDWGSKKSNRSIAQYIATKGEATNDVFHTFVYVVKPRRWYYVGAYTWTVATPRKVWGSVVGQNRQKVLDRLHEHSQKQMNRDVIAEMLDRGKLRQICVQLSGDDHVDISRAQCVKMKYSEPSKKSGNR